MNSKLPTGTPENITAIIDSREQTPWDLSPMQTVVKGLDVGDYSILGMESIVSLERKNLMDAISCCGASRERFQRTLDRLRGWPVSAVIIESTWKTIEEGTWKTPRMKMTPNHVLGSITSWIAQGHNIIVAPRPMAQRIARSILCHAAKHRLREVKQLLEAIK